MQQLDQRPWGERVHGMLVLKDQPPKCSTGYGEEGEAGLGMGTVCSAGQGYTEWVAMETFSKREVARSHSFLVRANTHGLLASVQ